MVQPGEHVEAAKETIIVERRTHIDSLVARLREPQGVRQLGRYLDGVGLSEGWLVLFDLRKEVSWEEKLTLREVEHERSRIRIVGC